MFYIFSINVFIPLHALQCQHNHMLSMNFHVHGFNVLFMQLCDFQHMQPYCKYLNVSILSPNELHQAVRCLSFEGNLLNTICLFKFFKKATRRLTFLPHRCKYSIFPLQFAWFWLQSEKMKLYLTFLY